MGGLFLGSALLALVLTALIVAVVRVSGMAVRRLRGRTEALTAERCFAKAVAAGDFDRAELYAGLLLQPAGSAARSPEVPPKREEEPREGGTLLLPPLSNPPFRNGRCVHGAAGACRRCLSPGRGRGVA